MKTQQTYDEIIRWYREISVLAGVGGLLHWDQQVNMPPLGIGRRSEQVALMDGILHRRLTDQVMVERLNALAERVDELDETGRVNVREIKREIDRAVKVPVALVEEMSRHDSKAQSAWVEARRDDNFAAFAPLLERTVELRKQEAAALGYEDKPYDAMLDRHEPFATESSIRTLLGDLRDRLVPFLETILDAEPVDASAIIGRHYPIDKQRAFARTVVKSLGFDFAGGRQDVAAHPFCSGQKGDVRITTRFFEDDFRPSLIATIHEAGHAMYEQGVPDEHLDTPRGEAVSLGVHESQSRFWENVIGRSLPFWKHFYPTLQEFYPEQLHDVSLEAVHRMMNIVKPSLIRVEADEVTYNLHIILRFEIEVDLVAGRISVNDLPEVWNRKMKDYLHIDVPRDADGVLQDIHWSLGALGYFPTYTIGNLYAAQLYKAIRADLADMDGLIERGDFAPILAWLREKIHTQGKRLPGDELIEWATGEPPSAQPLMDYLREKYSPIYGL
ncbi:MAG: carboxypeptidase M32 [Candidatus Lernaella stagnicola]|nr:carboxypeptidase M32 [Candidatus Lernaella stagnicola]